MTKPTTICGVSPWTVSEQEMRKHIARHAWPFYVYALCAKDGSVFYIGKGSGDRIFQHVAEAELGSPTEKCSVIRSLGADLRFSILLSCADEEFALMAEAVLIDDLWDRAYLTNVRHETPASVLFRIERTPEQILIGVIEMLDRTDEQAANLLLRMAA